MLSLIILYFSAFILSFNSTLETLKLLTFSRGREALTKEVASSCSRMCSYTSTLPSSPSFFRLRVVRLETVWIDL